MGKDVRVLLKPSVLFALVWAAVTERLILDSFDARFRWEDAWDYVTQAGADTGNDELQGYRPAQVEPGVN